MVRFVSWKSIKFQSFTETRDKGSFQFINPLLECDAANFEEDTKLMTLKSDVKQYIDNQINSGKISFASVYYRDLNNGPWIGINQDELFSPSSLIKVPLMMTYYHLAESNPGILKQELTNNINLENNIQNFKPEDTLLPNHKYTIEELISRMIIYSDNQSYELLNNNLDYNTVISVYNDLGVDISQGQNDPVGDILSVRKYASFFRILYNASYLNQEMSEKALKLLSQTKFTQGIVAGIPPETMASHKFGERQYLDTGKKQLHDCGIVYTPNNKPYLICIMTRGDSFESLIDTIKEISRTIFLHVTSTQD